MVQVQAVAGVTVLCSWASHLTLAVTLSPKNINGYGELLGQPNKMLGGNLALDWTGVLPGQHDKNSGSYLRWTTLGATGFSCVVSSFKSLTLRGALASSQSRRDARNKHLVPRVAMD